MKKADGKNRPSLPESYAAREVYDRSRRAYIRTSELTAWNPANFYSDALWLNRVTRPHYWPQGYWIRQTGKKYICIQIILDGDMKVVYENREYLVKKNDCIVIPPGDSLLSTGPSGKCKKIYFIPGGFMLKNSYKNFQFDKIGIIRDYYSEEFEKDYSQVCRLHEKRTDQLELFLLSLKLLMDIASKISYQKYPPALVRTLDFIGTHMAEHISLETIQRASGIGRNKLKNLFLEHLQMSPGRYLVELRLANARKMLENGNWLIKEIALSCGYSNPLYFSNAFKHRFGVSPKSYIENLQK